VGGIAKRWALTPARITLWQAKKRLHARRSFASTGDTMNSGHAATRIDYLPLPFSSRANRGALNRCMFLMAAA
jgi:hypothetical protein